VSRGLRPHIVKPGSPLESNQERGTACSARRTLWAPRQIVRLASDGLTNREIGERLFLSPRTVSSHLYRSYPKLGVAGRNQLRDVIARASMPAPADQNAGSETLP
jgi:DNA-binding NarL/FixJ family response regulator